MSFEGDLLDNYIVDYFQSFFSINIDFDKMDFLVRIEPRVNEMACANLFNDFTKTEILTVFKQMHSTNALGSDSMPPLFFQRYWHIIDPSITKTLLSALNSGHFPNELKHTFIILILKIIHP